MFWHDNKKTRCFETIFQNFLARAPPFKKRSFFTQFLPPLIRTQAGVKSGQLAQLHLNSTFCLSQSLPQSCNTKNWGRLSGPQNAVNYGVSWTYHAFYCKKSAPPQLKLTVLVPPEWHAFCTYGAGGFVFWLLRFFWLEKWPEDGFFRQHGAPRKSVWQVCDTTSKGGFAMGFSHHYRIIFSIVIFCHHLFQNCFPTIFHHLFAFFRGFSHHLSAMPRFPRK